MLSSDLQMVSAGGTEVVHVTYSVVYLHTPDYYIIILQSHLIHVKCIACLELMNEIELPLFRARFLAGKLP